MDDAGTIFEQTRETLDRAARLSLLSPWPRASQPAMGHGLVVLGSGSKGNCAALWLEKPEAPDMATGSQLVLIDLGLSPRVTQKHLAMFGRSLDDVAAVLLTHLDRDHCHDGWCTAAGGLSPLPRHCEVFLPRRSAERAHKMGVNAGRFHPFSSHFRTRDGLDVAHVMQFHDTLGTAAFRLTTPAVGQHPLRTLGYATDLGRVTDELINLLRGVNVLAIESNYCPELQARSPRPDFLKRRIMGGRGHLSNAECLEAIHAIEPTHHVVLLHLSRDCNDPDVVASMHAGADYTLTIASQDEPTRWIRI